MGWWVHTLALMGQGRRGPACSTAHVLDMLSAGPTYRHTATLQLKAMCLWWRSRGGSVALDAFREGALHFTLHPGLPAGWCKRHHEPLPHAGATACCVLTAYCVLTACCVLTASCVPTACCILVGGADGGSPPPAGGLGPAAASVEAAGPCACTRPHARARHIQPLVCLVVPIAGCTGRGAWPAAPGAAATSGRTSTSTSGCLGAACDSSSGGNGPAGRESRPEPAVGRGGGTESDGGGEAAGRRPHNAAPQCQPRARRALRRGRVGFAAGGRPVRNRQQ